MLTTTPIEPGFWAPFSSSAQLVWSFGMLPSRKHWFSNTLQRWKSPDRRTSHRGGGSERAPRRAARAVGGRRVAEADAGHFGQLLLEADVALLDPAGPELVGERAGLGV